MLATNLPHLTLHGEADQHVPRSQLEDFRGELEAATGGQCDLTLMSFSRAKHGFTRPEKVPGEDQAAEYSVYADRQSWHAAWGFLHVSLSQCLPV